MLCIDDDMVPGQQGLRMMLEHIGRDDIDIVSAITLRKGKHGPMPVLMELTEDLQRSKLHDDILGRPPGLYEVERGIIPGACFMGTREAYQRIYDAGRVWHKDVLYDGSVEHHELNAMLIEHAANTDGLYAAIQRRLQAEHGDFRNDHVGDREWGHDAWFCRTCVELGIRVWIDTSIFWGHLKSMDLRDFARLLGEVRAAKRA